MKKAFTILFIMAVSFSIKAYSTTTTTVLNGKATASDVVMKQQNGNMQVSFNLSPVGEWDVKSNQTLRFTPIIENGADKKELPAIEVRGRKAYIYYSRNKNSVDAQNISKGESAESIKYQASVAYEPWMKRAKLVLQEDRCKCVSTMMESSSTELQQRIFDPQFAYMTPDKEVRKARKQLGAYVDYQLSKTAIDSAYKDNSAELRRVKKELLSLKNDPSVEVQSVVINGYASPEGLIPLNQELAGERAKSMYDFIQSIYTLPEKLFTLNNCGEDWEGLKECVDASPNFPGKANIVRVMNKTSYVHDDAREWVMKSEYKDAYRHIYNMCYPGLRKATYLINYGVAEYSLEEAREIMKTNPQKLSAYEMYEVAKSYPQGSQEFDDVLSTALKYYPNDEAVNLNAANIAVRSGDINQAKTYLMKVNDCADKYNLEGIILLEEGKTNEAIEAWKEAAAKGCEAATNNLEKINE